MKHWLHLIQDLRATLAVDDIGVMVTVSKVRGSAPRESGAKMLIGTDIHMGTIGGGQLEHQCRQIAQGYIRDKTLTTPVRRNFPLGTNCGQCCGGAVDVLFEPIRATTADWPEHALQALERGETVYLHTHLQDGAKQALDADRIQQAIEPGDWRTLAHHRAVCSKTALIERICPPAIPIAVFGAGHVGQAVVNVLSTLDCRIDWIDSRPGLFNSSADNVIKVHSANPAVYAAQLPAGTLCLVMTHSHPLDFDVCATLLARDDIPFCGLIGSASKRARFERLFKHAGLSLKTIARLTCPIGLDGVGDKTPAEIAVAVAAQILRESRRGTDARKKNNKETERAALSA